jgi:hypothetical protein
MEIVGALSAVIDRHVELSGGRTDLGELAQNAAAESLATVIGADLPTLFGATPEDARLAIGKLGSRSIRPTCARLLCTADAAAPRLLP